MCVCLPGSRTPSFSVHTEFMPAMVTRKDEVNSLAAGNAALVAEAVRSAGASPNR
jgi:hypothetical protein